MKKYYAQVAFCIFFLSYFMHTSLIARPTFDYDLIIIGAGASGISAAKAASERGKKVALIEKNKVGGSRIWSGDIPFKTLFKVSKVLSLANNVNQFGLHKKLNSPIGAEGIFDHVRSVQQNIYNLMNDKKLIDKGIDIIFGAPTFIDKHTVAIKDTYITGQYFIIATGARSFIPPLEGIDHVAYLTRENFFDLNELPKSIIILGGGPLGCEVACSLRKLGVRVTLVMKHGVLLPTFDLELVELLTNIMLKEGIEIVCDMQATSVKQEENIITVTCIDRARKKRLFQAESLLIASGSTPNVEGLDLEKAGIVYSKRGIKTNAFLQTSVNNIYACGDVAGLLSLSRVAYYHAKVAVSNMYKRPLESFQATDYTSVAKVIFTQPLFASVGLTESDACKLYGNKFRIYRCHYNALESAHIDQNLEGLAKFICDEKGYLLGAHILGSHAGEIIDVTHIGKKFDTSFLQNIQEVRTSPSYFDIVQYATSLCEQEIPKHKTYVDFFYRILTWLGFK